MNKSVNTKLSVFIFLMVACISCVEKYWPDLKNGHESSLVVDGRITNEPGPYTITLSTTSSLQDFDSISDFNPVSDATVTITDDEGNSETLLEVEAGVYKTSETGIQGIIGRKYKLSIIASEKHYESEFEELRSPVEIESAHFEIETRLTEDRLDEADTEEKGYQFYVTTKTAAEDKNYYYWELEETYEYHAYYRATKIFNGKFTKVTYEEANSLFYCWNTNTIKKVFTQSTEFLSSPKIYNFPLSFASFKDYKLREKYCLLIKQFTISKNAYVFYKGIEDQNSNTDDLYTSQPYRILGNLVNTQNPEEAVLGYFLVAGVSKSPHIFTPKVFIDSDYDYSIDHCFIPIIDDVEAYLSWVHPDNYPLYVAYGWVRIPPLYGQYVFIETFVSKDCIDCRTRGGTNQKPDFWDD
ncbi:MAG: hypothetical protein CVU00_05110 [Bacteroidetes bacterium HGW-Bacteroidetes-17]|jgi:hypothetical protein|nr:MAG: hypothetical protein CVU00_05110 [Bacteroidetes bacterium HGW-Bacteroidetes-17]